MFIFIPNRFYMKAVDTAGHCDSFTKTGNKNNSVIILVIANSDPMELKLQTGVGTSETVQDKQTQW